MSLDFSAAEQFLTFLEGQVPLSQVWAHPAYQTVARHARFFGGGIDEADVLDALQGKPSPFYGLNDLPARLPRIRPLLDHIRRRQVEWLPLIEQALHRIAPGEPLDITVYPIIGYDMGIGLSGSVCMNLNCALYLDDPLEFLFYLIHECTHVIYERRHAVPPFAAVITPRDWRSYFNLWVHNEGFAVYAPLLLRQQMGRLDERDYRVLFAPAALEEHRLTFLQTLERLQQPFTREEALEICFGDRRLTYRMGCELIRRVEAGLGLDAVQQAFLLSADDFMARYLPLLMI